MTPRSTRARSSAIVYAGGRRRGATGDDQRRRRLASEAGRGKTLEPGLRNGARSRRCAPPELHEHAKILVRAAIRLGDHPCERQGGIVERELPNHAADHGSSRSASSSRSSIACSGWSAAAAALAAASTQRRARPRSIAPPGTERPRTACVEVRFRAREQHAQQCPRDTAGTVLRCAREPRHGSPGERGPRRELEQQRRRADSGLAAHEQDPPTHRRLRQPVLEPRELALATDQLAPHPGARRAAGAPADECARSPGSLRPHPRALRGLRIQQAQHELDQRPRCSIISSACARGCPASAASLARVRSSLSSGGRR